MITEILSVLNYGGILAYVGIDWGEGQNVTVPLDDLHFHKGQLRASHAAPAIYFPTCLQMLKGEGQTILVIDKNLAEMAVLVDRHHIIEKGRVVWQGSPAELAAQADVAHRFLGV